MRFPVPNTFTHADVCSVHGGNEKSSNQSLPAPSSGGRLHEVGTQQCGTWVKTKSFVFILWSAKTVSMFNQVLHTTETVQQLGVKKKKRMKTFLRNLNVGQ